DPDAVLLEPPDVAVTAKEPQQFTDDGLQMYLLGRDQGEALAQVEPHLVPEDAPRPGAGPVGLGGAVVEDVPEQILVRGVDRGALGPGRVDGRCGVVAG